MKNTTLTLITLLTAAVSANAAIVGFEAESGTLGIHFDPAIADAAALGGKYITSSADQGGTGANNIVTYLVNFAETGTYDLYGKIYVGSGGSLDDSFLYGSDFATTPSIKVNGIDSTQLGGVASNEVYVWLNFSDFTGTFGGSGVTFTVAAGDLTTDPTFQIAGRENGLRFDAFAFGTTGETFTDTQLDAAVIPEPGTYALLAGCFALASVMIRRRR